MHTSNAHHYGSTSLIESVCQALSDLFSGQAYDHQDIAFIDHFHIGGLTASRELAEKLMLLEGMRVLDAGCGIGGMARLLSAEYQCPTIGIDLNEPFVSLAKYLSLQTGLADSTDFLIGDIVRLPFRAQMFDRVITQHVSMNTPDKAALFASLFRVLKPAGWIGLYEIVSRTSGNLTYPLPWAQTESNSFLESESSLLAALGSAGFSSIQHEDLTATALAWFDRPRPSGDQANPVKTRGLAFIMGDKFPTMTRNLVTALRAGQIGLQRIIARRNDT